MQKITLQHVLGNEVLEYDVDSRGVIVDERVKDKYVKDQNSTDQETQNLNEDEQE